MLEEKAVVIAIEPPEVIVRTQHKAGCSRCESGQGCGGGVLASLFGNRYTEIRLTSYLPLQHGDQVVIGLPESTLLRSAILLYLLPLLGLFVGAISGENITSSASEIWSIAGGTAGLLSGLWLARQLGHQLVTHPHYQPVILRTEQSLPSLINYKLF